MLRGAEYTRVVYARYADDFIIGVEGNHELAKKILEEVKSFVENKLSLEFNKEKTGIVEYSQKPVAFLGYLIMAPNKVGINKYIEQIKINDTIISRRKKTRIRFHMDIAKVLRRLKNRGIIRLRTSHTRHKKLVYRGKFLGNMINFEHPDIIRYYNSVIRGLYNYYDFVNNRSTSL